MRPPETQTPEIITAMATRFKATGAVLAQQAQALAPKETGRLAESIRTLDSGADGCDVGSDVPYADDVELGTHEHGPKPYLRPAVDLAAPFIKTIWNR